MLTHKAQKGQQADPLGVDLVGRRLNLGGDMVAQLFAHVAN